VTRVLIAGTGAVGGYFGGLLARAGHDVVFLARGANLAALRTHGLVVESVDGDFTVARPSAVETVVGLAPVELVIVAAKSYDTWAVAAAIASVVGPETTVLSLQNGVENEAILAAALGLPPLLGAMTHIGAELVAPGRVRHVAQGTIYFGELGGDETPRTRALAALLATAGVQHRVCRDILLRLWDKLAWNAAYNAVTAVTRTTPGTIASLPATLALVRDVIAEVYAVARAQGIGLDDAHIDAVLTMSRERLPDLRTSMLQDVERGRRLEHDALNGAVIRYGHAVGVATPLNRTLHALVDALDRR
jgi:2-dehydropantoate 2-reductase